MLMELLMQVPEAVKDKAPEVITTTGIVTAVMTAFKFYDRRYGKKRDREHESPLREIRDSLHDVGENVKQVKWHVVGPNGDGGLVRDVEVLKRDVNRLLRHLPDDDVPRTRRER